MQKKVINKCKSCKALSWEELRGYEFNDLKESENRNVSKLINSIINEGFIFPCYIWAGHKYVIDGNGRNLALQQLEEEGWEIPDLPIVEIEANNKQHAKKLVLMASSQHGKITQESFDLFIEDLNIDEIDTQINLDGVLAKDLDAPEIDFDGVEENNERESKFKKQDVSCPSCGESFEVQI